MTEVQEALLRSVDASLKRLVAIAESRRSKSQPTVDLDGPHGNPVVKAKDPRDWSGEPMRGRTFSECPAAYLDLVADRLEYFASTEEDAAKKKYKLLDAARARGWAARKRAGQVPDAPPAEAWPGEPHW